MSDMLTPEEIQGLMNEAQAVDPAFADAVDVSPLTGEEADILGELGNMSMGASATTMYSILGRKVFITTPQVKIYDDVYQMLSEYSIPFIVVEVTYTQGLTGRNLLMLKSTDAALITDIMLGGDGSIDAESVELTDLHMSAISEVTNQMVAAGATSLSQVLDMPVNISPPTATLVDLALSNADIWANEPEKIIRISFNMEIEGLLKSELMQVMPYSFGKELVDKMIKSQEEAAAAPVAVQAEENVNNQSGTMAGGTDMQQDGMTAGVSTTDVAANYLQQTGSVEQPPVAQQPGLPPQQASPAPMPQQMAPQQPAPGYNYPMGHVVNVQPVQYPTFDTPDLFSGPNVPDNLDMIIDVPLQVSVELGNTRRSIKDVLDFNVGSVIVLEKLAGELVEVVVNGKMIARGEVVVIDENYGVRITEILAPARRL